MSNYVFHWSDYLLFGIILFSYAIFGIYIKLKYRNLITNTLSGSVSKEYFLANRSMGLLPVTASILVSFMSAITLLGTIAEVYLSGIEYGMITFTYFVAFTIAALVYLPIFYRLKVTSVHEYLELRFSKIVRILVSISFSVQSMIYMAVVLYAPALAFSQVSGLPIWISILSTGVVCTFYTAMGGMRAVIWTDLMQFIIMFFGLIAVATVGTIKAGGITKVFQTAYDGGRLKLLNFNPNPFLRHSFWTLLVGGTGMCMTIYATNQAQVQRYLSCKSEKVAKRALLINAPVTFVFVWLLILCGIIVYSTLGSCDPLLNKDIAKVDQIFPYFVMKVMGTYYPLPGLFLSTIFAAALSTVSSGINSLSTVIIEDIWLVLKSKNKMLNKYKGQMATIATVIVTIVGILTISLAFMFLLMSQTILQIALSLFGILGGPNLAVFTVGLFFPCINKLGALAGFVLCLTVNVIVGFLAIFNPTISSNQLPRNTSSCNVTLNFVTTQASVIGTTVRPPSTPDSTNNHNISYLYYTLLSVIICMITSFLVSWCTGFNTSSKVESSLLADQTNKISKYYPKSWPSQINITNKEDSDNHNILISSSSKMLDYESVEPCTLSKC